MAKEEMGMNKNKRNIVSIEDRIPKLKEARKKKANRRLVFYMTIIFFLISIIVYLQSPLSHVRTVEVYGNSFLTDEEVIELSELTENANIWAVDFSSIEENIQKSIMIEEAAVQRKLPATVQIEISEIKIVGLVENNRKFYPVLATGDILETVEYEEITGEAPLMIGFTDEEYLSIIANELGDLPDEILDLISEVHAQPGEGMNHRVMLYMNDGFVVQGTVRDFAEKMKVYPSVASQLDPEVKGIIHVGVGVYFEAFEQEEEEEDTAGEEEAEEDADDEL